MKRVLLIGGGGHCLSCMAAIESAEGYSIQGIVDASLFSSEATVLIAGYPVLGGDDRLPELLEDCDVALISVGFVDSCDARVRLF
ncbi:MAG: acetyltransferase, partial [Leptospirales bacterium]